MKHPERIADYLEHIVEASTRAQNYLLDVGSLNDFEKDFRNQDAVVRNIEIIGEAVTKIQKAAPDFVAAHPDIPWDAMRAMRNIITHEYFSVNMRIVWGTRKTCRFCWKKSRFCYRNNDHTNKPVAASRRRDA